MKKYLKPLIFRTTLFFEDTKCCTTSKHTQYALYEFLYIEKENEPLVVAVEGDTNIKVGERVKIGFTANRCHLFSSKGLTL